MSKFNFLVYLNACSDAFASNNPSLSNFKWARDINGIPAKNPISEGFDLAPGESKSLFSGTRTLLSDNTTVWSLGLKGLSTHTYVLTATSGTLPVFRTSRSISTDALTQVTVAINGPVAVFSAPAPVTGVAASFTGQVAGMTTNVTLTAQNTGVAGNSILLTGDGTSTVAQLAIAWNSANPSNQVLQTSGDFTQIPDLAAGIQLSGGVTAVSSMNMASVSVGDTVRVGSNFNIQNQGEFKILSKTANSFTVENQIGVNESVVLGSGFATQIQIYSAAGVQVGDTLVISTGFSPVTYGSYQVTGVGPNFVEFYSTALLPQESLISPAVINIYSEAKNLIYIESNQKCQITVNGSVVANLEPFIINDSKQPGMFMLKSTVYSLDVQNMSTDSADLFLATFE